MSEQFLDGRVTLHGGDNREVLKGIPDCSIDSIVTDPPYALVSIVKRFGNANSAGVKVPEGGSGAYARASAGFMGKAWDTGETAFATEFWAECLRVLKPGGHVVAFSGTRTYHRMACAIEDAGFEVRDMLSWLYGSGFPKSHDVSKGLDKAAPRIGMFEPFAKHYAEKRKTGGLTHNAICAVGGFFAEHNHGGASTNWEKGHNVPTVAQWRILQPLLGLSLEWLPLIERVEAEREKIGERKSGDPVAWYGDVARGDGVVSITSPATAAAIEWQGWGTALKPACEPICFGRKPLIGTVAANVLEHGTGAINVEGCRAEEKGRWPANIIHDGSGDVLEAFPSEDGASAARYFYTAKADGDDRLGSKHPTVKPVDLMQWLCRLVTPKGGTVLDPFAGTGTTGEAAFREGFKAVLIEREEEYQADIRRRMALVMAGPDERARESIKAKLKDQPEDHGPLFGGSDQSRGGADRYTATSPIKTNDWPDRAQVVSK